MALELAVSVMLPGAVAAAEPTKVMFGRMDTLLGLFTWWPERVQQARGWAGCDTCCATQQAHMPHPRWGRHRDALDCAEARSPICGAPPALPTGRGLTVHDTD